MVAYLPSSHLLSFFLFTSTNQYKLFSRGEFNIDKFSDCFEKEMENLVSIYRRVSTILHPTKITLKSKTILDLLITIFFTGRLIRGVISCDLSGHLAISVS